MAQFPDVQALAAAPPDAVLHLWAGLGYYSRARNLQRSAQRVVAEFHGELPDDLRTLQSLPGIGRSTAAAILALSRGQRHAILDGNVKRVLARVHAVEGPPSKRAVEQRLWRLADRLYPHPPRVPGVSTAAWVSGAPPGPRRRTAHPTRTRRAPRAERRDAAGATARRQHLARTPPRCRHLGRAVVPP
jgi:hypothetical protein